MGPSSRLDPLLLAVGMATGAAVGAATASTVAAVTGLVIALGGALAWLGGRRGGALAAAAGLAVAGAAVRAAPHRAAADLDGRIVAVRAVVVGAPEATPTGTLASLRIDRIVGGPAGPFRARARLPEGFEAAVGDEIVGHGRLRVRPGGAWIALREARRVGVEPRPVRAALEGLRGRLAASLRAAVPGAEAEWLVAATLGLRGGISAADRTAFRRSGAAHLLALSGLHVGAVAAAVHALAAAARLGRRRRAWATIATVVTYAAMTGASPSVVRAAIMACVWLAAGALGRPHDPVRALAGAAVLSLAVDPLAITDIGFQLSYAAAFSIAWIVPALRDRFAPGPVGTLFAVSAAAQAATAPIAALHFGQVSLVGLASNLVLVPLFGALVPAALGVSVAGVFWPAGAAAMGPILAAGLALARAAMDVSAAVPLAAVHVPPPSAATLAACAAAVIVLPRALAPGRARLVLAGLAVFLAVRAGATMASIDDGRLRVVCLDGAGLLHARDGRRALVLGPASAGEAVGGLARRGIMRLDLLVIAGDPGRTPAAVEVIRSFDVRRVALRPTQAGPEVSRIAAEVVGRGIEVEALAEGPAPAGLGRMEAALVGRRDGVSLIAAEGPRSALIGPAAPGVPPVEIACGGAAGARTLEPGDEAVVDRPGEAWRFL